MALHAQLKKIAVKARASSSACALLTRDRKNTILIAMADALSHARANIFTANQQDVELAIAQGLNPALVDRLLLDEKRLDNMIAGIRTIATLADPIGDVLSESKHANGMTMTKRRVPIGVICVIYESRPNVTADVAALCLKSGNAIILRGGREARYSNQMIANIMIQAGIKAGMPEHAIQLVTQTDREGVKMLVQMQGLIDLVIPRGGAALSQTVTQNAHVPVIKHDKGLCHTYIDKDAELDMAVAIAINAKCQRPGVCNAMETLLVHADIANTFLPLITTAFEKAGVECRGCPKTQAIIKGTVPANDDDWDTEYLDMIIAIKVVETLSEAIQHIRQHGSGHSEAIVSQNKTACETFTAQVDAAAVYCNASTRFTDGSEFGLGAEIGISTDKLHARGPMGLEELTTYKYIIQGNGQIRH